MADNLFQTSLYLFSALLQADAAILGFGTIFVVFRMQSLESKRHSILQSYNMGSRGVNTTVRILLRSDAYAIARLLNDSDDYQGENYTNIICIPKVIERIRNFVKKPIIVIGVHAVFSSILLFVSYYTFCDSKLQISLILIGLLWFAYNIFVAVRLAITMLTFDEDYNIQELLPNVYSELDKLNNKEGNE